MKHSLPKSGTAFTEAVREVIFKRRHDTDKAEKFLKSLSIALRQ